LGVELDMNKRKVIFFKNGEHVGEEALVQPGAHYIVGSLCGTGHKLSVVPYSSV
jgi:hypothetical protein